MKLDSKASLVFLLVPVLAAVVGAMILAWTYKAPAPPLAASQPTATDAPELRVIPKDLLKYEQAGKIAVNLSRAVALAVGPEDRVYVCGAGGIRGYDPVPFLNIDTPAEGTCIAVDETGRIYCGFRDHVEIFDGSGQSRRVGIWPPLPDRPYLTSIALSGDDVYLADSGNRIVWRCDRSGKVLARIGQKDSSRNVPGFIVPSPHFDVAMAPDGLLRVANTGRHSIEAYTTSGDFEVSWGGFGNEPGEFCGCCNPSNFCVLKDGRIVTAEKGLPTVKIYAADGDARIRGQLDCVVAGPEQLTDANGRNAANAEEQACDVAVDSRGRILVLDPFVHAVRIFVPAGETPARRMDGTSMPRVAQPPSAVPAEVPHVP